MKCITNVEIKLEWTHQKAEKSSGNEVDLACKTIRIHKLFPPNFINPYLFCWQINSQIRYSFELLE